jgi:hypothetical protein
VLDHCSPLFRFARARLGRSPSGVRSLGSRADTSAGICKKGATDYEDQGDLKSPMKDSAEALRHNNAVIAVVATLGSKRREIAELLKRHGANFINSYGMFSIEGLG